MVLSSGKREQKSLSWAWFGLWVFVSSFLWSPSRDGVEAIYALAFFIPMLAVLPWRKPDWNNYGAQFTVIALCYAGWSMICSLWGADTGFFALQWLVLAIWLAGSALVAQYRALPWDRLWNWLIAIGALTASINIAAFYVDHPLSGRLEGITIARAPTLVGQIYGVAALLAIIQSWRTDSFKLALLFSVAAIPALAAVGLSQSRGPLLALAFALVIGFFWLRPIKKIIALQCVSAVLAVVGLIALFPVEDALAVRGASFRDQIWAFVWQEMQAEPIRFLTGTGMARSTVIATPWGDFHHIHNAWLEILYRTGAIGVCLALVHLGCLLWSARQKSDTSMLVLWLIYGCGCLLVDSRSLFWEIDAKWFMYWVPAGLLAAALTAQKPTH